MLTDTINNLSDFLTFNRTLIPNIITFIIVVILIFLSLKSGLEFKGILLIYGIAMGILSVLGIDSVFNIITILENIIDQLIDLIFMAVI
jgi:hypothetical protein